LLFAPSYQGHSDADIILKDFASLPDGFNFENDLTLYAYILAFVFGVDAREFWPATAAGATKADATVQNQKARGRGIGALIRTWEWVFRQCIPPAVEFHYDFTDDEQDLLRYQVQKERVLTLSQLKLDGAITPLEERALAIADGIIDPKVLEEAAKLAPLQPVGGEEPVSPGDNLDIAEPTDEATPEGEKTLHTRPFEKAIRHPANAYYERLANDFQRQLESAVQSAIDNLPDEPTDVQIEAASEALRADLYSLVEIGLSNAYGVGLAGTQPTALGHFNLQMLASSQQAYLTNMIADFGRAISASVGVGLIANDLRGSLSGFVSRAALYAGAFWEAIWRGLGDMLTQRGEKLKVRRMLDDKAAHCSLCPTLAKEYDSFEALLAEAGLPGDGRTPCLSNCRCWVEVETAPGSGVF
ncbi:MAG: hypothetical protein L0Z53_10245, partial [Acidobacteriales bacterium]|nr:hypothetical protein [Terriglobales bacterium]